MSLYVLKSIEKVDPPAGTTSKNWFRYVIANDHNAITGYRCGTEKDVTKFAKDSAANLNEKYQTQKMAKLGLKPVAESMQFQFN